MITLTTSQWWALDGVLAFAVVLFILLYELMKP